MNKIKHSAVAAALLLAVSAVHALPEANSQKAWRPTNKGTKQKAVSAVPKILNEKMVVCGNKKLLLSHDGKIVLSNSSSRIATIFPFASYIMNDSGKTDWSFTDPKECKVRFEDGKVVWTLMKTRNGKTFKVANQVLEVMPDGILRLSGKFYDPACDDQKLRNNGSFFVSVPFAGNEGRKVIFNDKEELTVTKSIRHGKWNVKTFKYEVFAGSPLDTFTLSAAKPESKILAVLPVGKSFRFSCDLSKERTGAIYIDLRKSGVENVDAANTGAGVNFKQIEDLELPYINKNIMMNSSFEQNLMGWTTIYGLIGRGDFTEKKWTFDPFRVVSGGFHGSHALRLKGRFSTYKEDYRHLNRGTNLSSPTVFMNPGKYTMSFYAKQISGTPCYFNVWCHNFKDRKSVV